MKKKLSSFILFKLLGWKYVLTVPDYDKYIMTYTSVANQAVVGDL